MFPKALIAQLNLQLNNILGSLQYLAPELLLAGLFVVVIVLDLIFSTRTSLKAHKKEVLWWITLVGLGLVVLLLFAQLDLLTKRPIRGQIFLGLVIPDIYSIKFRLIIVFSGIFTLLISRNSRLFIPTNQTKAFQFQGEYYAILLAMLLGLHLLTMTDHLLMIYVSIELVSISSYILTILYFHKKGIEGALKYLLFGAFASGLMIYGMSWLYGLSGDLSIGSFLNQIKTSAALLNSIAAILVLGGILFKISAVPFHFWTPDAYQAAPTPVVAFFSVAPKVALLMVLAKVSAIPATLLNSEAFDFFRQMILLLGVLAILTVLVGNFTALWQQNVKRLLAYSTIAHVGVLLMGIIDLRDVKIIHLAFYLATYTLMNFGAFLAIEMVARNFKDEENPYALKHYAGLGTQAPLIGVCMVILMIALTGLPPTVGFQAKLFIFSGMWENYQIQGFSVYLWALIAGIFTTAVSLFYYLRIPFLMFLKNGESRKLTFSLFDQILLVVFSVAVLFLFFRVDWLFEWLK
ncbi:hypothetical protein BKI52_07030 [marine bacterium AO1-C]|nr:hypothetical protein BKI52_07030 [marine bacterium AO1-C]